MNLEEKFGALKRKGEKALVGFVTAGYPSAEATTKIALAMLKGGVDILELGLPFSDPIADGVTIQQASERSLRAGMNPDLYFEVAAGIKKVEKVCLTYYNLVLQRGLEKFVSDCEAAGIKGVVVPDLPVEEARPLLKVCDRYDETDLIFLVAPTTTEKRLAKILEAASGFVYVVSLLGVTGARETISSSVSPLIRRIREQERVGGREVPLAVGFGISKPEQVRKVCGSGAADAETDANADGAIVGSAFIKIIEQGLARGSEGAGDEEKMLREIEGFAGSLKRETLVA